MKHCRASRLPRPSGAEKPALTNSVTDFLYNYPLFFQQWATTFHASEQACCEYLIGVRWPMGFVCPNCSATKGWTTGRGTVFCSACQRQTSPTAGTILHNSRVPLRSWFLAMWLSSRKRQAARDRLAILKKGNPAMNHFPCGGDRQAIQAPPARQKPRYPLIHSQILSLKK